MTEHIHLHVLRIGLWKYAVKQTRKLVIIRATLENNSYHDNVYVSNFKGRYLTYPISKS